MRKRLRKKLRKRILAGTLAGVIVLTPAAAALAEPGDLQGKLQQTQGQLDQTKTRLNDNQAQQNDLVAQMAGLDQRVSELTATTEKLAGELSAANAQKTQNEQQLAVVQAELDKTLAELAAAKQKLHAQQQILNGRAKGIYQNGKKSYLEVILSSGSFQDFVNRFSFLQLLGEQDAKLVQKVKETKSVIEAKERQQEQEKQVVQVKQAAVVAEMNRIGQLKAAQDAQVAALQADKAKRQVIADQLKQDQAALFAMAKQEEAEAYAISAQINQWNAQAQAGRGIDSSRGVMREASTGGWVWPAGGPGDVTSEFGPRYSPTAGASSNHMGIDIGLPEGTPIVAAHSGVVSFAGYSGGYGNYTVIDNGDGVSTCYGHQSDISVSQGQQVSAGQVIGSIGSTGVSTGPHLHFEIRVEGDPQNPMNWLG